MCGIAGFLVAGGLDAAAEHRLGAMTGAIAHRGPDGAGCWLDPAEGIALGHRRLAIIDLSPAGHQPMPSASGRYMIAYNGEIYNHRALRERLERDGHAPVMRGHSDTEVLLACVDAWGLDATLAQLNGMFAFALWDRRERRLILARDRTGEKPLYYGQHGDTLLFGSELKALTAHPAFEKRIDRAALAAFMRLGYVPAPASIWAGIRKLPPAHVIEIAADDRSEPAPRCYWDLAAVAAAGVEAPAADTPALVDELEALLRDSVALRMEADVPLGGFLSGGVDSSLITALMQAQSTRPVRTFSIGFADGGYDESAHARAVAAHLATDHHEFILTAAEARAVLPQLPAIWDEPFADTSQIPTYLVSQLARAEVTVALTGDGGDELFAGYNRHTIGARIWRYSERLPMPLRRGMEATLSASLVDRLVHGLSRATGIGRDVAALTERMTKIGAVIGADDPAQVYARLVAKWPEDATPVLDAARGARSDIPSFDLQNAMLFMDMTTYLPDDILAKVDRAAMAVGLEGRIPFLDHRLIEFAWRVPLSAKIRDGRGKQIVRDLLYRYVPRSLIDRPKAGFGVPVGDWLVASLRPWAQALLDPARLRAEGLLDADAVAAIWDRFCRGERSLLPKLWCVLMFQAWLEHQGGAARAAPRDLAA